MRLSHAIGLKEVWLSGLDFFPRLQGPRGGVRMVKIVKSAAAQANGRIDLCGPLPQQNELERFGTNGNQFLFTDVPVFIKRKS